MRRLLVTESWRSNTCHRATTPSCLQGDVQSIIKSFDTSLRVGTVLPGAAMLAVDAGMLLCVCAGNMSLVAAASGPPKPIAFLHPP